jgi:HAMP domain-containing protein
MGLEPQAGGHINDSWLGTWETPTGRRRFLLQHVNRFVFRRPERVMENMARVTRHVAAHVARDPVADPERRVLTLVPTREGATHHREPDGEVWRLVVWIEGTRSSEEARTPDEAHAAARAFGRFLRQLADLPGPPLHETIPGFHDTPSRFTALEAAVAADAARRLAEARPAVEALLDRRSLAHALADRVAAGELEIRTTHNDAKMANVLFDAATGESLCVVDLDTVMPGLALHDFGDMVRSMVSNAAEDETDLERVSVRLAVFEALARGFVEACGDTLSPLERSLLPVAGRVITLEQAVRFLTDHLEGDPYYRISHAGQNLDRARAQLRLLEALESADPDLQRLVDSLPSP